MPTNWETVEKTKDFDLHENGHHIQRKRGKDGWSHKKVEFANGKRLKPTQWFVQDDAHPGAFLRAALEYKELIGRSGGDSGKIDSFEPRPILYNLRHVLELTSKAMILQRENRSVVTHSLIELWPNIKDIFEKVFEPRLIVFIEGMLTHLDTVDMGDDTKPKRYDVRYPHMTPTTGYYLEQYPRPSIVLQIVEVFWTIATHVVNIRYQSDAAFCSTLSPLGFELTVKTLTQNIDQWIIPDPDLA